MTLIVILNIVFAAFVVIAMVGLHGAAITSDRSLRVKLARRRTAPAPAFARRAPQRRPGQAIRAS